MKPTNFFVLRSDEVVELPELKLHTMPKKNKPNDFIFFSGIKEIIDYDVYQFLESRKIARQKVNFVRKLNKSPFSKKCLPLNHINSLPVCKDQNFLRPVNQKGVSGFVCLHKDGNSHFVYLEESE